jgi:GDP-4-dehydro-6-deoxy-D-mannose reductase
MHVLITGVAGFVGSRLSRLLLERGDRVSGTYLGAAPSLEGMDLYEADVTDRAAMERSVQAANPDAIVNLAGLSHIGDSWDWRQMPDYFWVNVVGTENVLAAAEGRPVVIASSADVYGAVPEAEQPIREDRRIAPQTPYALTKAAAERLAVARGAVIVRSFNLIGPEQAPKFALPRWAAELAAIRRGEKEPILEVGDLSTARDFVHVDDGAAAYRLLAEKGSPGGVYNLASGKATRMRAVLTSLIEIAGIPADGVEVREGVFPPRPFDIPRLSGDPGRLQALGWRPERSVDDALADLWKTLG